MKGSYFRLAWLLSFAVLLVLGGLVFWHYAIRTSRTYAEEVHGIFLPPSAADIQTRRSGLGFQRWGTDNYIVSVFRMQESEFTAFTDRLSVVKQYEVDYYSWPAPLDGFRAVPTEFRGKYAMIDFSSPTGDGLRCYLWRTNHGLLVRLTTAYF